MVNHRSLLQAILAAPIVGAHEPARRAWWFMQSNPLAMVDHVLHWDELVSELTGQCIRITGVTHISSVTLDLGVRRDLRLGSKQMLIHESTLVLRDPVRELETRYI